MRNGRTMPARLYHKLAFGADGAPGASRTLVISLVRNERSDPQRTAELATELGVGSSISRLQKALDALPN